MRELASKVGLSASFLSLVERSRATPSLSSLRLVADALATPIFYLLLDGAPANLVVRKGARRVISVANSPGLTYELLTPDLRGKMEAFIVKLEPGAPGYGSPLSHPADEWLFVLEGKMRLTLGGKEYLLEPGDNIYFDGTTPHKSAALGDEVLIYLCVNSQPIF